MFNSNITYDNACQSANGTGQACQKFQFEPVAMHTTLVSEMELVCQRSWWVPLIRALPNIGILFGQALGAVMDNYWHFGRRRIMMICFVADTIVTGIGTFMPDPTSQAVFKFLRGVSLNLGVFQVTIITVFYNCNFFMQSAID